LYFILINGDLVRTIDFDGGISVKDKTQIYLIMIKQWCYGSSVWKSFWYKMQSE